MTTTTATKTVNGYTFKLRRVGFAIVICCYYPNKKFSHIVTIDTDINHIKNVWNNLKVY